MPTMRSGYSRILRAVACGSMSSTSALVPAHPEADDVDEREHASLGSAKDLLTVVLEVAPAGAARIHHRRRARGQRHVVGEEGAAVPVVVAVNVHEPRDHVESLQVHPPFGGVGGDARGHARDPSIADGHIPNAVDLVGRIDDVTAGQEQVVRILLGGERKTGEQRQKDDDADGAALNRCRQCTPPGATGRGPGGSRWHRNRSRRVSARESAPGRPRTRRPSSSQGPRETP